MMVAVRALYRAVSATLAINLCLTSCALAPAPPPGPAAAPLPQASFELDQVPFFPQQRYRCGPAALATILAASGIEVTAEQLTTQIWIPAREGSLQIEVMAATRALRRVPYVLDGTLESLFLEVQSGHPVLVLQNLGLSWFPRWHYAVVIGYDANAAAVILRSGLRPRHRLPVSTFARTWRRAANWAMIALPPDRLPETVDPERFMRAAAGFEVTGDWVSAESAYRAVLGRWPRDPAAAVGLGNVYFSTGEFQRAEHYYRLALEQRPDSGLIYNNLAQTLARLGRHDEADAAIRRAMALSPAASGVFKETQEEIRRLRMGPRSY